MSSQQQQNQPLGLAIIGTNWITHSFVTHALSTPSYALKAVYSRTHASASTFASKYPSSTPTLYTSLSDLAGDTAVKIVYIASPNTLHYPQAKQMLEAGKHVILEKPSCTSTSDLEELFALAKKKGVFLLEAFRHIQERNFKILKREVGKLGALHAATLSYCQFSSRYDKLREAEATGSEPPNIFSLAYGGGALVDLGIYTLAAAVALFGAPKDATYFPQKVSTGADGAGTLVLTYEAGFVVTCLFSKVYDSKAASEIHGERGTLRVGSVTDIEGVSLYDPRKKTSVEVGGEREEMNLREEAVEFARIVNGGDWGAAGELERLSVDVVRITEKVRRENGLLFPGEE